MDHQIGECIRIKIIGKGTRIFEGVIVNKSDCDYVSCHGRCSQPRREKRVLWIKTLSGIAKYCPNFNNSVWHAEVVSTKNIINKVTEI